MTEVKTNRSISLPLEETRISYLNALPRLFHKKVKSTVSDFKVRKIMLRKDQIQVSYSPDHVDRLR